MTQTYIIVKISSKSFRSVSKVKSLDFYASVRQRKKSLKLFKKKKIGGKETYSNVSLFLRSFRRKSVPCILDHEQTTQF